MSLFSRTSGKPRTSTTHPSPSAARASRRSLSQRRMVKRVRLAPAATRLASETNMFPTLFEKSPNSRSWFEHTYNNFQKLPKIVYLQQLTFVFAHLLLWGAGFLSAPLRAAVFRSSSSACLSSSSQSRPSSERSSSLMSLDYSSLTSEKSLSLSRSASPLSSP